MSLKPFTGNASALRWIKSSYSGSDDNDCVEVAAMSSTVRVRDSKRADGPQLAVAPTAWTAFVSYAATSR
ncbi:DUF397 domain-containing protein [Streptomyces sp. TRM 70351]|uniref:DUF397 domain-containing protein n=1 Tax=Streptomyces sp. TRM 70351 TaxID=3116552 RepID=UPI002E7B1D1C|nr:DUF397 domain-containing protein [Streptomyces sp. TRM 70351]MEE1930997.1 DUF397 domain-containing protein [Streptomyces sp. TRM 70351]